MLKQRLLSAFIIIVGISLLILILNNQYLTYLVALISSISLWEFLKVRFTNAVSLLGIFLFLILMFVSFSPFFSNLFINRLLGVLLKDCYDSSSALGCGQQSAQSRGVTGSSLGVPGPASGPSPASTAALPHLA